MNLVKESTRQRIDRRIKEEAEKSNKKPVKKAFFRKRKYVDPCTGLVFDASESLAENKQDYLNAFAAVCRGEFKDLFEAHAKMFA